MVEKSLNLLIVAESIDPNTSSGGKANLALITNFIESGFNVKVFHYTRKEIIIEGAESVDIPENRRSFLFFLSRVERYIRQFLKINLNPRIEKKTGFSFTLKNDRNSIVSALKRNNDFNPDWILTLSQGGSFRPHHALLKIPDWHPKWIAYIHDPYPMHWYPKPYTWEEPGYMVKQKFMEAIADHSKYLAFPSLYLKEWMGFHYPPFFEKGIVIPHQLTQNSEPVKPSKIELDPVDFNILHAGNLLQARQPQGLIKGFKKFLDNNPMARVRLIHVGPSLHYEDYLQKEAEECKQLDVYCGNYPFKEVIWLQENASVNIIIEAKAEFSPFLPGKFPHCIASGNPILLLGPPKSEAHRLLGNEYPYWTEIDDVNRISEIIEELYENWTNGKCHSNYNEIADYLSPASLKQTLIQLRV